MSYSVSFYNFSKRRNSTSTPSGSGNQIDVLLKENTSLYNPVFELSGSNYPSFTYASWQGLYYYVTDIVSTGNNLYEVNCELDAMGSAAGDILSLTTYVERSSSDYNILVPDMEIVKQDNVVDMETGATDLSTYFDGTGCYVMRTVGGTSTDGINTYIHSQSSLENTLGFLWSNDIWDAIWDTAIKTIFNPFQYVVSLKFTPISYTTMTTGATNKTAYYGWWADNYSYPSPNYTSRHITSMSLNKPARYYNDWRDYDSRFTRAYIILPGGELHVIPSSWLSLNLKLDFYFDVVNGEGAFRLWNDGYILSSFSCKLLFDVQIGQVNSTPIGVTAGATGVATGYMMDSKIAAGMSAIGLISDAMQPNPSVNGTSVGCAGFSANKNCRIVAEYYGSTNYPVDHGRALCDNRTLSSLSGFCKCTNASVDTDLPAQYKDEINGYLNSGFFIE